MTQNFQESFKVWVKVLFATYLVLICSSFFNIVIDLFIQEHYSFSILKLVEKEKNVFITSNNAVLIGLFIAPILEEIIFRNFLKVNEVSILISIFTVFLVFNFLINEYYLMIISSLIFLYSYFNRKSICLFVIKKFRFFYWTQATLFALLHITNFSDQLPDSLKIFALSFVLPQFFLGLFAGFIRMRVGIFAAVLYHIIFNLPSFFKLIF